MAAPDHATSFPVHGGTCTVVEEPGAGMPVVEERDRDEAAVVADAEVPDEGFVRVDQTVLRHLHWLFWLVAVAGVVAAAATALTDWRYVTGSGAALEWYDLLLVGLVAPALRALALGWRRLRGYTGATRLRFDEIEAVELTTTSIRWYLKTRRTVPLFVVTYRADGAERRRRILLDPRWEAEDLRLAVDAVRDAGLPLRVDDDARALLADATD